MVTLVCSQQGCWDVWVNGKQLLGYRANPGVRTQPDGGPWLIDAPGPYEAQQLLRLGWSVAPPEWQRGAGQ